MTSIYTKTKKTSVNTEVNEKSSIVVRLLRQPGRNAFTTSESIYDLYSKHENYKDSTSKSKEIHCIAYIKNVTYCLNPSKHIYAKYTVNIWFITHFLQRTFGVCYTFYSEQAISAS